MHLSSAAPLLALLTGCPGGDKPGTDSAMTEESGNPDSDSGGGTDSGGTDSGGTDSGGTDSGSGLRAITGTATLYTEREGVTACDMEIAFSGPESPADCPDCAFVFDLTATAAGATEGCANALIKFNFLESGIAKNPRLAFQEDYRYTDYTGTYYHYTDVLMTGIGIDYSDYGYGYYAGPYWQFIAYDGAAYGTVDNGVTGAGGDLSWTYTRATPVDGYADNYPYQYCAPLYEAEQPYAGAGYSGGWGCDALLGDVWTFPTTAGAGVTVSIDTVGAGSTFDPFLYVIAADTCAVAGADDSFDCAFPPRGGYQCPSATFTGDGAPVTLVIGGYDNGTPCGSDGAWAYTLAIDNDTSDGQSGAAGAELIGDDVALQTATSWVDLTVATGAGTVSR